MPEWWTSLPEHIDPVAFVIGSFSVRWYAVCFIFGFFVSVTLLLFRSRKGSSPCRPSVVWDAATALFVGILLGGRLGYALWYDPSLLFHPVSLVWPIDPVSGVVTGIRGMSFFGASIGSVAAMILFVRSRRISFWTCADFVVPVVPLALLFGRIGNTLNLELPGRLTDVPWAMYFPDPSGGNWELRHPSQLYEALLEGMVLFLFLSLLRKRNLRPGALSLVFLSGYAVIRFFVEFFREPDPGVPVFFGWMTMGQSLSIAAFFVAAFLAVRMRKHGKA